MRFTSVCLAALAALAAALPVASRAEGLPERHEISIPPQTPLYCEVADVPARVEGADFGDFYTAVSQRLGWRGRTMIIGPQDGDGQRLALFEHMEPDRTFRGAAFYLEPYRDGLALVVADFLEPNHPLMSALGENLCDYVRQTLAEAQPG